MKNKNKGIISLFTVLFVILIYLIYNEVTTIPGLSKPFDNKVDLKNNMDINFSIDTVKNETIRFSNVLRIEGWTFIKDQNTSGNKVYIMLNNENSQYIYEVTPVIRPDLPEYFKENNLGLENAGFISMVNINDLHKATYRIGLIISNGDIMNYIDANRSINVNSEGVDDLGFVSAKYQVMIPNIKSNSVISNIDEIKNNSQIISISGWSFLENADASKSKIYIVLKKDTTEYYVYNTILLERPDVESTFPDKGTNIRKSGFIASVLRKDLEEGFYEIEILIENDNNRAIWQKDGISKIEVK